MATKDPQAYQAFMKRQLEEGKDYLTDGSVQQFFKEFGLDPAELAKASPATETAAFSASPPRGPAVVVLPVPVLSVFANIESLHKGAPAQ